MASVAAVDSRKSTVSAGRQTTRRKSRVAIAAAAIVAAATVVRGASPNPKRSSAYAHRMMSASHATAVTPSHSALLIRPPRCPEEDATFIGGAAWGANEASEETAAATY